MAAFAEFGLCPELAAATEEQGWSLPTDIQAEAIPLLLGGGDLLASAETGSGKTAAFALPILQLVHEAQRGEAGSRYDGTKAGTGAEAERATELDLGDRDEQVALQAAGQGAAEEGAGERGVKPRSGASSARVPLLVAQSRDPSGFFGVRATRGLAPAPSGPSGPSAPSGPSGPAPARRASFAVRVADGLVRLGWSTASASLDLGTDEGGWGFGGTGMASHGGAFAKFGGSFGAGDVIESLLDLDAGEIRYAKNGKDLGVAFRIPGAAGPAAAGSAATGASGPAAAGSAATGAASSAAPPRALFPTVALKNAQAEVTFFEPGGELRGREAGAPAPFPPSAYAPSPAPLVASPHALLRSRAAAAPLAPSASRGPLAIVLEPTRELAEQAFWVLAGLSRRLADPPVRCGLFLGGKGGGKGENGDAAASAAPSAGGAASSAAPSAADAGASSTAVANASSGLGVDVAVGTASRMVDLADKGSFPLSSVRHLVLDEADALLAYGHRDPVLRLWRRLPKSSLGAARLQAALFSATLHDATVVDMATRLCQDPIVVDLKGRDALPGGVQHAVAWVDPREDRSWLQHEPPVVLDGVHTAKTDPDDVPPTAAASSPAALSLAAKTLKQRLFLRIVDALDVPRAIVFCRTNHDCDCLKAFLDAVDSRAIEERIRGERGGLRIAGDEAKRGRKKEAGTGAGAGTGTGTGTGNGMETGTGTLAPVGAKGERGETGTLPPPPSSPSPSPPPSPSLPLHSSAVLGGAKSARDRRAALEAFKAGSVRFLIATDVAARGIDVRGLPYAFNMTLPTESEEYVHRVGRVGRAGAAGVAISLVSAVPERVWFVQKSGAKPWAARGGADADDVATHTVWLDEPELLAAVETRLQMLNDGIPRLQEDLSLPEGFVPGGAEAAEGAGGPDARAAAARAKRSAEALQARLAALQPSAKRLETLERESQERFFAIQQKIW